jgi:hypothetical protein
MNETQLLAELDEYMPSFVGEPAEWSDVLRRARRPHRRRLMIASIAVALVAVPAALAFGSKLVDLFEGTPPTPAIQTNYINFNRDLSEALRNRFSAAAESGVRPVDLSQIHGVTAIQTSEGEVDLWSAPEQGDAGACFFVEYADELGPGGGGCDPATTPNGHNILPGNYWTHSHPSLQIIYGYTYGGATSVEVDLTDGSTVRLPVTEQYYFAAIDANAQISRIVSYDAQDKQVGVATLSG